MEAYPDVANNYVRVITQWPGQAAEEVEQQITVPVEIVMNGTPHLQHLRSVSLFGLSSLTMIFDDESQDDWNREKSLKEFPRRYFHPESNPKWDRIIAPSGKSTSSL